MTAYAVLKEIGKITRNRRAVDETASWAVLLRDVGHLELLLDDIKSLVDDYETMLGNRPEKEQPVNRHDPATWTTRQLLRTFVWGDESRYHERVKELLEDRGISVDMLDDEIERLLDKIETDAQKQETS